MEKSTLNFLNSLSCNKLNSKKDKNKYEALVLSGGGIKGFSQLGSLKYYEEIGLFDITHIKEYAGTSVGTIICLLCNCGYTANEIFTKIYNSNIFQSKELIHKQKNMFSLPSIMEMYEDFGLIDIFSLFDIVQNLVKDKFDGKVPTLSKLYEKTGKIITFATVNVSSSKIEYINYKICPKMSCTSASMLSCNIPLIFTKKMYKDNLYCDGGLLDGFPIFQISRNLKTLGIITIGEDFDYNSGEELVFPKYIAKLISMPINKMVLQKRELAKLILNPQLFTCITIKVKGVFILELFLNEEKKMSLFLEGYNTTKLQDSEKPIFVNGWNY
jgi:predicted acylesterase/phospholipase RssA